VDMKVSPEQLQAELLRLPTDVRARLAEALLASLDQPDAELDIAWGDEAERRSQEIRSGGVKPIPAAEARARARSKLKSAHQRRKPGYWSERATP